MNNILHTTRPMVVSDGGVRRRMSWATNALLLTMQFSCLTVTAQHYADKWYFGNDDIGLDFTPGCDPTILTDGNIEGFEGCATIADPISGELLFYTNSAKVWGRDHQLMPNGLIQLAGVSVSQNTITQVLITPIPDSDSLYYIFTNQVQGEYAVGMRLSCVNMSLNNGNGDVIFKNTIIYADTVSEKVTAIRHANGTDIWVIGHDYPGDHFFAFLITSQGIQYPPVISTVGKTYSTLSGSMDCIGEIKGSPNGLKLAAASSFSANIELFDFDAGTGVISAPILLEAPPGIAVSQVSWWYGLSFSPNNTLLYAGKQNFGDGTQSIIQFDITSNDSATINMSKTVISTMDDVYSLQLAPNGQIYARRSGNYLGVIRHPDLSGIACDFDPYGVDFGHSSNPPGDWGFNNYIALPNYPCLHPVDGVTSMGRTKDPMVYPNPGNGLVEVRFPHPLSSSFYMELFNAMGECVGRYHCAAGSEVCEINVSTLPSGSYILRSGSVGLGPDPVRLVVAP